MFYQRLRKLCKEKGITVTKMVNELGLSSANLSNWKSGRLPKTEIAFKIAEYLNISVYELIGEEYKGPKIIDFNKSKLEDATEKIVEKVFGEEIKKPLSENEKWLDNLYNMTKDLSESEKVAIESFVAGLKANRKP